jgi:hypothetical protein
MKSNSTTPHGRGVRGLSLPRSSVSFEGNFGRIFRALSPAEFGDDDKSTLRNLGALAALMVGPDDAAKDGPDPEESGIPSLFTYLGQFVDHDITFDPASSLQQQNDIDGLTNFRTPRFDLDNIYGRGPADQPYLYFKEEGKEAPKLILGKQMTGGTNDELRDLPRNNAEPARAIIGDPRSDENVIVSQFQAIFFAFHNRMVDDNPTASFPTIQKKVRWHYQWMLINDFLPTIISDSVYDRVFPHRSRGVSIADAPPVTRFYKARNEAYMPLEFSAAAYRFGHSMIRPGYRLNDDVLLPIFADEDESGTTSLRGFREPNTAWGLDWGRYIDIDDRPNGTVDPETGPDEDAFRRLQLAYRIDTSVVKPLSNLPTDIADRIIKSLIERNLVRGWRLRLPSGQDVARAMGVEPLESVFIGSFEDGADTAEFIDLNNNEDPNLARFAQNCPLWVYILAETLNNTRPGKFGIKSNLLGDVGGTIIAETFAGLLKYDSHSFLNQHPRWQPEIGGGTFGLKEFVRYAVGL